LKIGAISRHLRKRWATHCQNGRICEEHKRRICIGVCRTYFETNWIVSNWSGTQQLIAGVKKYRHPDRAVARKTWKNTGLQLRLDSTRCSREATKSMLMTDNELYIARWVTWIVDTTTYVGWLSLNGSTVLGWKKKKSTKIRRFGLAKWGSISRPVDGRLRQFVKTLWRATQKIPTGKANWEDEGRLLKVVGECSPEAYRMS